MDDDDDFTSYSDLLKPQEAVQSSPQKPGPDSQNPGPESPRQSPQNPKSPLSPNDLLKKQALKVNLYNERNTLVAQRAQLLMKINEKKRRAKILADERAQIVVDRTLEALIHQNDSQFGPGVKTLKQPLNGEHDDAKALQKQLDVSPSEDWVKRLEYIRMFYKDVDIITASVTTTIRSERMVRVYTFVVISPGVFKVPVSLVVDSMDNRVLEISFESKTKRSALRHLGVLCPTFHRLLLDQYIPQTRLDSIMYGLNSLSLHLNKRIDFFLKIIPLFTQYLIPTHALEDFLKDSGGKARLFLRSVDKLEFLIPRSAEYNEQKLTVHWDIVLHDLVGSDCEAAIAVDLGSSGMIKDVTFIYMELMEKTGVVEGLRTLFSLLFSINVD